MKKLTPFFWLLALWLSAAGTLRAAETIPPAPARYFNDYALTVKPETADRLNKELEDFERQTSIQLRVAIFPKMLSDSSLEDYTQNIFRAWKIGQKDTNNGAVLFIFLQDHKIRIQTGYGLEGALPDATSKDIIADKIAPRFKANDYDGGLTAGVEAMIQAAKGEYKGSGKTNYEREHAGRSSSGGGSSGIFVLIVLAFIMFSVFRNRRRGTVFSGSGPATYYGGGWGTGFGGGFSSSGGGDSGGFSSGDGGGFASSGGGDSGGGGASGDW